MSACLYVNLPPSAFWRKYDGCLGRMSTHRISWMFTPRVFNSSTILIPKNPAAPVTTTISPFSLKEPERRAIVCCHSTTTAGLLRRCSRAREGRLQGAMFNTSYKLLSVTPRKWNTCSADGLVDRKCNKTSEHRFHFTDIYWDVWENYLKRHRSIISTTWSRPMQVTVMKLTHKEYNKLLTELCRMQNGWWKSIRSELVHWNAIKILMKEEKFNDSFHLTVRAVGVVSNLW